MHISATHIQTYVPIEGQVYAHAVAFAHMCLMYGQTVQVVDDFSRFCPVVNTICGDATKEKGREYTLAFASIRHREE